MHASINIAHSRYELEKLRRQLIVSPALVQTEVDAKLQVCIARLERLMEDAERLPQPDARPVAFMRSVDRMAHPYIETDDRGIIRRTNKALTRLFGLLDRQTLAGWPLVVFIDAPDRKRFIDEYLVAKRRHVVYSAGQVFRVGMPNGPRLACFMNGQGVRGNSDSLAGIIWLLSKMPEGEC
jgi:PAS domain-containing protein